MAVSCVSKNNSSAECAGPMFGGSLPMTDGHMMVCRREALSLTIFSGKKTCGRFIPRRILRMIRISIEPPWWTVK